MKNTMYDDIMEILTEYTQAIGEQVSKKADKLSKEAVRQLRERSPRSKLPDVKHYADSWSITKFGKSKTFRIVIHESTAKYRLTHLLENGFTHKPDNTFIKGRPHIKTIQDKLNRDFEAAVEDIIKNT